MKQRLSQIEARIRRDPDSYLFGFVYFLLCSYFLWLIQKPFMNWDMLGYMGVVANSRSGDTNEIHRITMEAFRQGVPDWLFKRFGEEHFLANSADIFRQQLPFYSIKPLYPLLIAIFEMLGAGLAQATWLVSQASFALLALCLAFWRPQNAPYAAWLTCVLILMWAGDMSMITLGNFSTPDGLSTLLTMAAFISWARYGCLPAFAGFGLFAITARPESSLIIAGITCYFTLFAAHKIKWPEALAMLIAIGAAYFAMTRIGDGYSWERFIYYNNIYKVPDIANASINLSPELYQKAVTSRIGGMLADVRVIALSIISVAALVMAFILPVAGRSQWLWLMIGTWAGLWLRFLIAPSYEQRYYFGFYLIIIIACLELLSPLIHKLKRFDI